MMKSISRWFRAPSSGGEIVAPLDDIHDSSIPRGFRRGTGGSEVRRIGMHHARLRLRAPPRRHPATPRSHDDYSLAFRLSSDHRARREECSIGEPLDCAETALLTFTEAT